MLLYKQEFSGTSVLHGEELLYQNSEKMTP